jgi:Spy/CpxP family protein refolding chaperone
MLGRSSALALLVPVFAFVAPLAVMGCGGTGAQPVATVESGATRAPIATSAHGLVRRAGQALGDVPLAPNQRASIEKLAADVDAHAADTRAARKALVLSVANQVEQGHIDRTVLQPQIDQLVAAKQKAQPAERAGLEELHGILSPDQRVAFVNALEAHFHEGAEAEGAHPGQRGQRWAEELKLTDEQRSQIRSILHEEWQGHHGAAGEGPGAGGAAAWRQHGERAHAVLEAFKQDHFALDEVAPPRDIPAIANTMSAGILGTAERILPILTPEQRALAAAKLRARAARDEGPEL